jgi:2-dehydro-3-deoxygalactonokinase
MKMASDLSPLSTVPGATRILLDWGTSSLRSYLVADSGAVIDVKASKNGVRFVTDDGFEAILQTQTAPWRADHGPLPIYGFGMIGSRNGWVEMPYAECPAGPAAIAAQMARCATGFGADVVLAPGVRCARPGEAADVMRGEEVYLVALAGQDDATVVLPGTHSKWAQLGGGCILAFQTFLTGELYALLVDHSFVAAGAGKQGTDWAAFDDGLDAGLSTAKSSGGLLARLFGVRTRLIAGRLDGGATADFLSGLLIGAEFREAESVGWTSRTDKLVIVGSDSQTELYARCARRAGLGTKVYGRDLFIAGALRLAHAYEHAYEEADR